MTEEEREKAIEVLNTYDMSEDNDDTEFKCAVAMALEALKQEPILDKIRAEIEAKCCITVGRENDGAITLHDVFEILDKHKAESEG